jgi:hypothetical protein
MVSKDQNQKYSLKGINYEKLNYCVIGAFCNNGSQSTIIFTKNGLFEDRRFPNEPKTAA